MEVGQLGLGTGRPDGNRVEAGAVDELEVRASLRDPLGDDGGLRALDDRAGRVEQLDEAP